jgi:hypothetical protein
MRQLQRICAPAFTSNGGISICEISWNGHYNQAGTPRVSPVTIVYELVLQKEKLNWQT